jgi:hypothetical protein
LPNQIPAPENNAITPEQCLEKLFFDPRLSTTGQNTLRVLPPARTRLGGRISARCVLWASA